MRLMIAGDSHGQEKVVWRKAAKAKELGANTIFIVGDFGLWPGKEGVDYLDAVNDAAREFGLRIIALPGNHEDHPQWDKWLDLAPLDKNGFAYVRSNLLLTKKVHPFKLGGKRFFVCGGAVSIDKRWRTEGKSWWRNETFSEADLKSVEKYKGPQVDFLLTHDCSDNTPWKDRLKPDPDSLQNRLRIDRAMRALRPKYHFHGHMHTKYEWNNSATYSDGTVTKTFGLECDNEDNSFVILDTGADNTKPDKSEVNVYWPTKAGMLLNNS